MTATSTTQSGVLELSAGARVKKPAKPLPEQSDRSIVSHSDWRKKRVFFGLSALHLALLVLLVLWGIGPLLWLLKSAITPTQDTLQAPMELFPHGVAWSNLWSAWFTVGIGTQFLNTVWVAIGSWFVQLLVATTAGYVLAVLRPAYAKVFNWLVLATLFVPAVVLLVPLYLTILHPPLIGVSLINTFWAVWLPAGANAFNILLVTRFFSNLPREIFEAARTDGAGPLRLFWSIVLPLSRPILGVVSVFAIINAWKDYLWPMLVLTNPAIQPLSVRLPNIQSMTDLGVFLAALAISMIIPIALFLFFQRMFLRSAGLGGAVKG
ncbi:MAG: carbohydrate transporter permease [Microbacteriaceae bacterium]|nr:carbohydrate transporter permease [Microbacteriaceae bacterium]